jgi:hypothetical protein
MERSWRGRAIFYPDVLHSQYHPGFNTVAQGAIGDEARVRGGRGSSIGTCLRYSS